jgi:hypothetical protein
MNPQAPCYHTPDCPGSRCASGGIKLACSKPWHISLASQRASARSVFRPGTFLTWAALTKNTVKSPYSRL